MGLTKTENYTDKQNELAQMMKALAHPARIAIIQHLVKANACICNDLVEIIGLAQATTSQHLKELKMVGIIQGSIEGTSVCYCINKTKWDHFRAEFELFFGAIDNHTSCC